MADDQDLIDIMADQVKAVRRKRFGESLRSAAALGQARTRAYRTGEDLFALYDQYSPERPEVSARERKQAQMRTVQAQQAATEQAEVEAYYKRQNDRLKALQKRLEAALKLRGQQSDESKARARNAISALKTRIRQTEGIIEDRRKLDQQAKAEVNILLGGFEDQAKQQVEEDLAALKGDPTSPEFQAAKERTGLSGLPDAEARAMATDEVRKSELVARREQTLLGQATSEKNRQRIRLALINSDAPKAQILSQARQIANKLGVTPQDILGKDTKNGQTRDIYEMYEAQVATEARQDAEQLRQDMKGIVTVARRVGAPSSDIKAIESEIDQVIAEMALTPTQVSQRIKTRVPRSPEDYQRAITGAPTATSQAAATLEYIRDLPEDDTAKDMQRQIMSSPEYKNWQKSRGYENFDAQKVYKEFDREFTRAGRSRNQRFREKIELNRQQGLGFRSAPTLSTPEVQSSPSADMVAGSDTEAETLDGQSEQIKRK